jgi:hypothetical protein
MEKNPINMLEDINDLRKASERTYGMFSLQCIGDDTLCVVSVPDTGRMPLFHQCAKRNGYGPNNLYCKIHSPEVKALRQKQSTDKWNKKMRKWHIELAGHKYHAWAQKILANNPQGPEWDELMKIFKDAEREI